MTTRDPEDREGHAQGNERMKMLYWHRDRAGYWQLFDTPPGEPRHSIGSIVRRLDGWRASFWGRDGRNNIWTTGRTVVAARTALQDELHKRSIGLFGEDHILFQKDQLS